MPLTVKFEINKLRPEDRATATFQIERKRGEGWNREKSIDVLPGEPDATRTILLEHDQRIVILGRSETVVIYDREQMATREVALDPEIRAAIEKAEADQNSRQNIENEDRIAKARHAAQEAAKKVQLTNIGKPIPADQPRPGVVPPPSAESKPSMATQVKPPTLGTTASEK